MTPLPIPTFRKPPAPGWIVIDPLLDLLPLAGLIVDANNGRIYTSNARATELTSFTRLEITNQRLEALLPDFDCKQLKEQNAHNIIFTEGTLRRRNGQMVDVHLSLQTLDPHRALFLITMEPDSQRQARLAEQQRLEQVWEAFKSLAASGQAPTASMVLAGALEAGCAIMGGTLACLYLSDPEERYPLLLKRKVIHGPAELLPDHISTEELNTLKDPQVWVSRKRARAAIQEAARQSNLEFLASAPVGGPGLPSGLVTIAGTQAPPQAQALSLLKVFSASLISILQNQMYILSLEQQAKERETHAALTEAVLETVQDGIVVVSPGLTIIELNPSAEEILGYATQEVQGVPYQNILVGAENIIPPFLSSEPGLTMHVVGNIHLYRRDGQALLANVRTVPVTAGGKLQKLLVLIEDLSQQEQIRLRSQVLEQRALLGEVTASFAHEVRNPINNISMGLQLMAMNLGPQDANQEMIGRLQQDCDRLAELMKGVLAFARPMEYKLQPVNLGLSLQRVMERWRPHLARVNIQYSLQVEPETPYAEGDMRALEQVWNNLISNAIQAMGQNGTLTVKARPITTPDDTIRVEVSISDTGTGIPEEIRERIFEPFFTTNQSGNGLGLAITRQIVTAHKGTIHVTSIPGGTSFQVRLPVAVNPPPLEIAE